MSYLLPMLILAVVAEAPIAGRHPDAVELFRCDFGESFDVNYDRWPDGWHRKQGVKYPSYLKLAIDARQAKVGERSLRIDLDGGAAVAESPPIKASSLFSYVVEGYLRTEGLTHDVAYYSVTFYDDQKRPLETFRSEQFSKTTDWEKVHIGPIAPQYEETTSMVIGLHLAPGEQADLTGAAMFDDVWVGRLPRVTLYSNSEHNVYSSTDAVEVTCEVSGILERDPVMTFELVDVRSQLLATSVDRLEGGVVAQQTSRAKQWLSPGVNVQAVTSGGFAGEATWKPPIDDFGFYQVRVTMRGRTGLMHQRSVTVAVVRPQPPPSGDEFGWSLPRGDDPVGLDSLVDLLLHVGVRWIKFPVWYSEQTDPQRADDLGWFVERLNAQGIEVIGLLDQPPVDQRPMFGQGADRLPSAAIFSDPAVWHPVLGPVMTRLSLKVRWWQLGRDDDTSFVGYPEVVEKVAEVKSYLERFGQEIHLSVPWDWLHQSPDGARSPWSVLSWTTAPPLTGRELGDYLQADSVQSIDQQPRGVPGLAPRRWVTLRPLARSQYDVEQRARDLVERILAAKVHGADGIFIPEPFDDEHGLMNADGTPGELLLPWRTTALLLSDSRYIGSVRLPGGSENHIFARGEQAVMIVWNDRQTTERVYLGEDVQCADLWGKVAQAEKDGHRQAIPVGPMPKFVSGVNTQIVKWRQSFRFNTQRLSSVFGRPQTAVFQFTNPFDMSISGRINIAVPDVWTVDGFEVRNRRLESLAPGEQREESFQVTLRPDASSGVQPIRVDFAITGDRHYRFSVWREIEVGLGDVVIELSPQFNEDGDLVITQYLINRSDKRVSFQCTLFAPNRRRVKKLVLDQGRGRDASAFVLRDGGDLAGKTLLLRAEEIGGDRILNYPFTVEH